MFIEVQFPKDIALGARGGPERRTDVVSLRSGAEERNSIWANSRRKYNATYGIKTFDQLKKVVDFFETARGRLYGFRFYDNVDCSSNYYSTTCSPFDQLIGIGDGAQTEFQLIKTYGLGVNPYQRIINKPVDSSVLCGVNGVETKDFTIDTTTGIITLQNAPDVGEKVTAGFYFDVPVRFDIDYLELSASNFNAGSIPSIDLIEIRL